MEAVRMFTFSCRSTLFPQARVRGFSLVVALIFLLVLSMLGIAGVRNVILHERMAGNTQDWNLAFQAAEAALRDGEADAIARAGIAPATYVAGGCGATGGLCQPSDNGIPLWVRVTADDPCWRDGAGICRASQRYGAQTGRPALTDPNTNTALGLQPRYVIENLGVISGSGSGLPLTPGHYGNSETVSPRYAFRVTAVGFGNIRTPANTPATRVVLQTTIGMN